MVYVINGDECHSSAANLSRVRNRLFTAITLSKAWVRVTGIDPGMTPLIEEFGRVKDADFELAFRYPTLTELDQLTTVHRDMTDAEQKQLGARRKTVSGLVEDLREGRLFAADLEEADLAALRELLGENGELKPLATQPHREVVREINTAIAILVEAGLADDQNNAYESKGVPPSAILQPPDA